MPGLVHLSFNEMVMASSFQADGLLFESLNKSCFEYEYYGEAWSSCDEQEWSLYQGHILTSGSTVYTGANAHDLTFFLSEYDKNAIKVRLTDLKGRGTQEEALAQDQGLSVFSGSTQNLPLLCKSRMSTWLSILPGACTDMTGNSAIQHGEHHTHALTSAAYVGLLVS